MFLVFSTSICYSQESNVFFQERTNNETERRLAAIEGTPVSLTTGVSGILPLANGGTAAALVDPDADRIGFWDDSEGTFEWLTLGTGLTITATTINAEVKDYTKLSTTTFTSVSNSEDISITAGKRYRVYININTVITGDVTLYWRFDSDSTGGDYQWGNLETTFEAVPSSTPTGSSSDSKIELGDFNITTGSGCFIDIDATAVVSNRIVMGGYCVGEEGGGVQMMRQVGGIYIDGGTLTDFEILTSANTITGSIVVYELN